MDLPNTREFIIKLSREVGKILKNYFFSQDFKKHTKETTGDIVTQADLEVDAYIRKALSEKYPEVHVMTEETTSGDYRSLKDKEWLFIVDPLDGTINFSRNIAHFGVAIGLMHKGFMQMSVAYLPMQDEMYWADAETDGAYLNNKLITTSSTSELSEMMIACDWSNNSDSRKKMLTILSKLSQKTRRIKCLGSPVADLCLVAKGDLDGYVHTRLRPWDITPAFIVKKAGGLVTNFNEPGWDIFHTDIIASNNILHEQLSNLVPFTSSKEIR